jgi:hypothetical protein
VCLSRVRLATNEGGSGGINTHSSSHTSPSSKESSISSRREWKRGVNALGCVCLELG